MHSDRRTDGIGVACAIAYIMLSRVKMIDSDSILLVLNIFINNVFTTKSKEEAQSQTCIIS